MCGIAGVLQERDQPQLPGLRAMTAALRHRGPDDEGFVTFTRVGGQHQAELSAAHAYSGPDTPVQVRDLLRLPSAASAESTTSHLALGHRRLAILDLSAAGHQPMSYAQGRYWIVFNGAVYNHAELRTELAGHGYEFRSGTDTEVLMAAYDRWGPDCLPRCNGMWAFLLLDRHRGELLIARDRLGVKPLFFHRDAGSLVLASQIDALLRHPSVKSSPNEEYLQRYLQQGAAEWRCDTAFTGIQRFPAAHYALVCLGDPGQIKPVRYWELTPDATAHRFDANRADVLARRYRELLTDAVRLRLQADVPVGSALSGGLDSSSIVQLVAQIRREQGLTTPHNTFSSIHTLTETRHLDESKYIARTAAHCRVESHTVEPTAADVPTLHPEVIRHCGNPPGSTGVGGLRTYQLARELGLKVTLDGQGADEQLAGYSHHKFAHLQHLPASQAVGEATKLWRTTGSGNQQFLAMVCWGHTRITGRQRPPAFLDLVSGRHRDDLLSAIRREPEIYAAPLNVLLGHDLTTTLANLTHYADARSMYHGIETRMPFLDYRLVEFLARVPACYKIHGGYSKYIARLAFAGRLPDEIVWRRQKLGWSMPEQYWLEQEIPEWVRRTIAGNPLPKQLIDSVLDTAATDATGNGSPHGVRRLNLARWQATFFPMAATSSRVSH